jgi:hypothetical protein
VKHDIAALKEIINVKKEIPWDCKSLMMRFKEDMIRRSIIKKLYAISWEYYEEPEPIELSYSNSDPLSREAREFLALPDEDKIKAVEREFPPKHVSDEEAEECQKKLMAKLDVMRDGLGIYTT